LPTLWDWQRISTPIGARL